MSSLRAGFTGSPPHWGWWVALAAIALGTRLAVILSVVVVSNDGSAMLRHAWAFAHGDTQGLLDHAQHPAFGLALSALIACGLPPLAAGQTLMLAAALAAVAACVWFGVEVGGARLGLACGFLAAVNARMLEDAATIVAEPLYVTFLVAAATCGARALRTASLGAHAGLALAGALAYLTRPEGLVVPAIAGSLLAVRALGDAETRRRRMLGAVVGLALAVVLAGPYVAWVSRDGTLRLTRKKTSVEPVLMAAEARAVARWVEAGRPMPDAPAHREAAAETARRPWPPALRFAGVAGEAWTPPVLFLTLLGLGVAAASGRRTWRKLGSGFVLAAWILAGSTAIFAWHFKRHGYIAGRHFASLIPFAGVWAVAGAGWLTMAVARITGRAWATRLWILTLVVVIAVLGVYRGVRRHGADKEQEARAARALADALRTRDVEPGVPGSDGDRRVVVFGDVPRAAFYAGVPWCALPEREPWMTPDEWRAILDELFAGAPLAAVVISTARVGDLDVLRGDAGSSALEVEDVARIDARRDRDDLLVGIVRRRP